MSDDLVSIIMPSHDCGRFVGDAIRSIINQTYTNWELLIVDDCSEDDTQSVVQSFRDPRIRYFKNDERQGAALSRNRALREAKGRWMAFLDSDDLWLPNKLEHQIRFMKEHGYAFSYHDYVEMDEQGRALGVYVSGKARVTKLDMFSCCWPGCLTVMYDASKIGLIQVGDVKKNNDTAMWLKVINKADGYLLSECLAKYRRRANSITPPTLWRRIWAHYPLFHVAEEMNPVRAAFWVVMNVFGNAYKKMRYVHRLDK